MSKGQKKSEKHDERKQKEKYDCHHKEERKGRIQSYSSRLKRQNSRETRDIKLRLIES